MERDLAERDALKGVSDSLAAEKAALHKRLAALRADLEADTAAADAADAELQRERAVQGGRLGALDKVLRLYRTVLGLELVPGEGERGWWRLCGGLCVLCAAPRCCVLCALSVEGAGGRRGGSRH